MGAKIVISEYGQYHLDNRWNAFSFLLGVPDGGARITPDTFFIAENRVWDAGLVRLI